MTEDEIMQELRALREEYAAEHEYDLGSIFEDAKKHEGEGGRRVLKAKPKRISPRHPETGARDSA
jgi:hypothetical protein